MSQPRPVILKRQIKAPMAALLRAVFVSHGRVRALSNLRLVLSVLIAGAGVALTFVGISPTPVTIIGAIWALIYSVGLASWAEKELLRAAVLQEMFYIELFELPWNPVIAGEPLRIEDVSQLSKRYRGTNEDEAEALRDWYERPDLPHPFNVLGQEQQNLAWGGRIRRRYAQAVLAGVITWIAVGLVFASVAQLTLASFVLSWLIPSLGLLLLGIDTYREQHAIATARDRVCTLARNTCIRAASQRSDPQVVSELVLLARQLEDVLFLTRRRAARVPSWFFQRFYNTDRHDFEVAMQELRDLLGADVPITTSGLNRESSQR